MFLNKDKDANSTKQDQLYIPGVYSAALILNDSALNLEVLVDANHINSVEIVNIDEATTTMFPLINPSLELISSQLYDGVLLEDVEFSENSQYTQTIMLDAVKVALEKAKVQPLQ